MPSSVEEKLIKRHFRVFMCLVKSNWIQVRSLDSGDFLPTLKGHSDTVTCLEVIDENRLASGSKDTTVKLWNTTIYKCVRTLKGHVNKVNCLQKLCDNAMASGSIGEIRLWNLDSGACIRTLCGQWCLYSNTGKQKKNSYENT